MNNENAIISAELKPTIKESENLELIIKKPEKSVYKRKYGVIRIANEKELRKITYEELKSLSDPKKLADMSVNVSIPSQKIKLPLSRIVFQEAREEITEEFEDFAKLPTKTVVLNLDYTVSDKPQSHYLKTGEPFILATAHVKDGVAILDPIEKVQSLLYMEADGTPFYPHSVVKIVRYGEKV